MTLVQSLVLSGCPGVGGREIPRIGLGQDKAVPPFQRIDDTAGGTPLAITQDDFFVLKCLFLKIVFVHF